MLLMLFLALHTNSIDSFSIFETNCGLGQKFKSFIPWESHLLSCEKCTI